MRRPRWRAKRFNLGAERASGIGALRVVRYRRARRASSRANARDAAGRAVTMATLPANSFSTSLNFSFALCVFACALCV
ncbi:MAG: hypothetical protein WKF30_09940 [Pyrinomonadaceae bacterium]